jgi:alkaline phosphatase D
MTPPISPMDRRSFLRTVAVGAAALSAIAADNAPPADGSGARPAGADAPLLNRTLPGGAWHYPAREELLPFGHGVASGDPLADRIILWTRVTIPDARGWDTRLVPDPQGISEVAVAWVIATDPALSDVVRAGSVTTDATVDFTVKVDADGLSSATTYWYAFTALGYRSPIGRTRTAPTAADGITELTIGHVACTSWWQDLFNGYARMGERGDIDLITHAGDHVYEVSGNHMSSRQYPDSEGNPQLRPYDDIDNRAWRDVAECRRRYALYYQDENLLTAHLGAPWAIMADQHDYDDNLNDDGDIITESQAGEVLFEWSPIRPPVPDGSGTFPASPGPNAQVPVPRGDAAFFSYRTLDFGDVAQIVLLDVRRHRDDDAAITLLGHDQWAWLQATLTASRDRGARHNVIVSQLNLSQFVGFSPPGYDQYAEAFTEAFGQDPRVSNPIITFEWDARPDDRRTLYRWLRGAGILDNIVLTGDSHGWFGSDLTEDPEPPAYVPLTGASPLQPVGVEMVGTSMGRPGAQDVIADTLYWAQNGGRGQASFDDAETYDQQHRRAALPAALLAEQQGKAANKNLIYFNWKAEYGHAMVHLRTDKAIIENWVSPQRAISTDAELVAQHTTPIGNPHLVAVVLPTPVIGTRQDQRVLPATVPVDPGASVAVASPPVASTDGVAQDITNIAPGPAIVGAEAGAAAIQPR